MLQHLDRVLHVILPACPRLGQLRPLHIHPLAKLRHSPPPRIHLQPQRLQLGHAVLHQRKRIHPPLHRGQHLRLDLRPSLLGNPRKLLRREIEPANWRAARLTAHRPNCHRHHLASPGLFKDARKRRRQNHLGGHQETLGRHLDRPNILLDPAEVHRKLCSLLEHELIPHVGRGLKILVPKPPFLTGLYHELEGT